MEMKSNVLVIVDMQNDFCHKEGSMYIKGSEKLVPKIEMVQVKYNWERIIYCKDNHQSTHNSFIENGGQFPSHCVTGTWGGSYSVKIFALMFFNMNKKYYRAIKFDWISKGTKNDDMNYFAPYRTFWNFGEIRVDSFNFFLVGVATDYCVEAQYHYFKENFPNSNVYVIDELTLPIKEKPKSLNYITLEKTKEIVGEYKQ